MNISAKLKSKDSEGNVSQSEINHINPESSSNAIAFAVGALYDLSKDTVVGLTRVADSEVDASAATALYNSSNIKIFNAKDNNKIRNAATGKKFIVNESSNSSINAYSTVTTDNQATLTSTGDYNTLATSNAQDNITIIGDHNKASIGSGLDSVNIVGSFNSVYASSGFTANIKGPHNYLQYGADSDAIRVTEDYTKVFANSGNDSIFNSGANSSINGGSGRDTIKNTGSGTYLVGAINDDRIINSGDNVTINAGVVTIPSGSFDSDRIENSGSNVSINAGAGNDSIYNSGNNVTIYAGRGNDTIVNEGAGVVYQFDSVSGNNTIHGFNLASDTLVLAHASVLPNSYNVSISNDKTKISFYQSKRVNTTNYDTNIVLYNEEGYDFDAPIKVSVRAGVVTLNPGVLAGSKDKDSIVNSQSNITIQSSTNSDTIVNSGDNVWILSTGEYPDSISNSGSNAKVSMAAGNDTIYNSGANSSINAGLGRDWVYNSADNVTIFAGAGSDRIFNNVSNPTNGNTYQFAASQGINTINGFNIQKDKIQFLHLTNPASINAASLGADMKTVTFVQNSSTILARNDNGFNFGDTFNVAAGTSDTTLTLARVLYGKPAAELFGSEENPFAEPDVTIWSGAGRDTIYVSGDRNVVRANLGANTIFIQPSGTASSDTAISVYSGGGSDTINVNRVYTYVEDSAGLNVFSISADHVAVKGGSSVDNFTISGSNNSINGGSSGDIVVLTGSAQNNTLYGAGSADVYDLSNINSTNSNGNYFYYAPNQNNITNGADSITGFNFDKDFLLFDSSNITLTPTAISDKGVKVSLSGVANGSVFFTGVTSGATLNYIASDSGVVHSFVIPPFEEAD